ncbi:MAG: hypothetical protein SGI90_00445, partial [Candidatus Eisenbacteria bacterium]|nr:hypothetical protein [Candidatus Eisenbacteria bacterium]
MRNKWMLTIAGVATTCGTILLASALTMGLWGCQSGGQNNATRNPPPASTTPPPDQAMNQPHSHPDPGTTAGEPAETIPARTNPKPTPAPRRPKP